MKYFLTASLIIMISACTSYQPPKNYNFQSERVYELSYDNVWTKILGYLSELGSPINHLDKNSGFINTEFTVSKNMFAKIMDCGVPADDLTTNKFENPMGRLNVIVSKVSDTKTKVKVTITVRCNYNSYSYQNYRWNLVNSTVLDCNSTGYLEQQLLNSIY